MLMAKTKRSAWHLLWYPVVIFAVANLSVQFTITTHEANLFSAARPWWLLMALAGQLTAFAVLVPMMRHFYARAGIKLELGKTFDLIVAGLGFAKVVPAGEYLLWRSRLGGKKAAGATTHFMVLLYSFMASSLILIFLLGEALTIIFYPTAQSESLIGKFIYVPLAAGGVVVLLALALRVAEVQTWLRRFVTRVLGSTTISPLGIIRERKLNRFELASFATATLSNWLLEALTLWFCLFALGQHPPFVITLFGYTFARIFQMVPVIPGGVGENEALTTLFFAGYGYPAGPVFTGTIIFRVISYWLPIVIGSLTYFGMKRRGKLRRGK